VIRTMLNMECFLREAKCRRVDRPSMGFYSRMRKCELIERPATDGRSFGGVRTGGELSTAKPWLPGISGTPLELGTCAYLTATA
jgi:hypothetical protein